MSNNIFLNNLILLILETKDKELLEDLIKSILTTKELEMIPIRLELIKRLLNGEHHHKIAKDLKIGVATVTRGSNELKRGHFKILQQ